jgi:hypothetical protein
MNRYLLLLGGAIMVACSGEGATEASSDASGVEQSAQFTDTIIAIDANGEIQQSVRAVTSEERRAELEALSKAKVSAPVERAGKEAVSASRQALLHTNTTCQGSDLWVYDESLANRICISGSFLESGWLDSLDFSSVRYGRCIRIFLDGSCFYDNWAGKVAWIWPGSNGGRIYNDTEDAVPSWYFNAWAPRQPVNPATSRIVWLLGPA